MQKTKLNANAVGASIARPHFEGMTQNKGITLIALIITIIVMLILVGVTINVAINGGLFEKADKATKLTQKSADEEELQLEIVTAYNEKEGTVDLDLLKTNLVAKGWNVTISGDKAICTSPKGNTYTVDVNGKITEGKSGETDDDLAYMKAELEGKTLNEIVNMEASNVAAGIIILKNSSITFEEWWNWGDMYAGAILSYNEKEFLVYYDPYADDSEDPEIIFVYYYATDSNNYFDVFIRPEGVMIYGLTENGSSSLATTKKLVIPKAILGTDGRNYNVTELYVRAFSNNTNIEQLEFENGIDLVEIGRGAFEGCANLSGTVVIPNSITKIYYDAFKGCTSIESLTLPNSVDNLGRGVFDGWTSDQTIYMQGRTEEPATTDEYTGELGWYEGWKNGCNANIVWDK